MWMFLCLYVYNHYCIYWIEWLIQIVWSLFRKVKSNTDVTLRNVQLPLISDLASSISNKFRATNKIIRGWESIWILVLCIEVMQSMCVCAGQLFVSFGACMVYVCKRMCYIQTYYRCRDNGTHLTAHCICRIGSVILLLLLVVVWFVYMRTRSIQQQIQRIVCHWCITEIKCSPWFWTGSIFNLGFFCLYIAYTLIGTIQWVTFNWCSRAREIHMYTYLHKHICPAICSMCACVMYGSKSVIQWCIVWLTRFYWFYWQ